MPRIHGNAEAWQRYDRQVRANEDGAVDHGRAAIANLREAGEIAKAGVSGLAQAIAGRNIIADGNRPVHGVGHYLANLGIAGFLTGALMPIQIVKDISDAALHGVLAGFDAII